MIGLWGELCISGHIVPISGLHLFKNGFKSSGSSGIHCFVMLGNYLLRVKKLDLDHREGNSIQNDRTTMKARFLFKLQ